MGVKIIFMKQALAIVALAGITNAGSVVKTISFEEELAAFT